MFFFKIFKEFMNQFFFRSHKKIIMKIHKGTVIGMALLQSKNPIQSQQRECLCTKGNKNLETI